MLRGNTMKALDKAIMIHYMIEDNDENRLLEETKLSFNYNHGCKKNEYDKLIFMGYFKEELEKQRQLLLNKLSIKDYFIFAYETGYIYDKCYNTQYKDSSVIQRIEW